MQRLKFKQYLRALSCSAIYEKLKFEFINNPEENKMETMTKSFDKSEALTQYQSVVADLNSKQLGLIFSQGVRLYIGGNSDSTTIVRLSVGDDNQGAHGELMACEVFFSHKFEFIGPDSWSRDDEEDESDPIEAEIEEVRDYLLDQGELVFIELMDKYLETITE